MADEERTGASGPSLGSVVEWTLKVGPVLLGAVLWIVSLYTNQAAMIKHDGEVDKRLAELERFSNAQDRELTKRLAGIDAALSELNHDLQFYQATRSNGK